METRIGRLFGSLREQRRPGLIAYITAGDPSPDRTVALVKALERGGADLIELGIPFSDPIADGPMIQRGSDRALKAGTTVKAVLEIASEIRRHSEIPIILFTYLNPVLRYGFEVIAQRAVGQGIDGFLLTDLSVEEAHDYVAVMRKHGLDTIFLAAPTSSDRRLALVAQYSTGFVYLVSRTGVTGEQQSVSDLAGPLVKAMRAHTSIPLAVGFGISKPDQVAQVGAIADAVVVGSAFVRMIEDKAMDASLENRLETFTRELRQALPERA